MSPLNRLSSVLDQKWTSYAVAGSALLALPAASNAATIINVSAIDLFVDDNGGFSDPADGELDLDGDTVVDYTFTVFDLVSGTSPDTVTFHGAFLQGTGSNQILTSIKLGSNFAAGLGPGDTVGPGGNFSCGCGAKFRKGFEAGFTSIQKGEWPNDLNQTRFVGLAFDIGGSTHYGWAEVGVHLGSAALQVHQYGYETLADTETTIPGAEVPEPSSMALMLLGAAGVGALKLRRRAKAN